MPPKSRNRVAISKRCNEWMDGYTCVYDEPMFIVGSGVSVKYKTILLDQCCINGFIFKNDER